MPHIISLFFFSIVRNYCMSLINNPAAQDRISRREHMLFLSFSALIIRNAILNGKLCQAVRFFTSVRQNNLIRDRIIYNR